MKHIRNSPHGARGMNDTADIDNLFQLTTFAWVSDSRSEKRKETILNNVWKAGLKSKAQAPYTVALRKWLRYSFELRNFFCGLAHQMTYMLLVSQVQTRN